MKNPEPTLLNCGDIVVTPSELKVGERSFPLLHVNGVQVISEGSYGVATVPVIITVACVLWALTAVLNAPADYFQAGLAIVLASLSIAGVRLVGSFQTHTLLLLTPNGETSALSSRDGRTMSDVAKVLRRVVASHATSPSSAWLPGQRAAQHG